MNRSIKDENGILVQPGNVGEIANAMVRLTNDKRLTLSIGKQIEKKVSTN
jgi:glycosyltransferase involved in cell wall biosynthesis